MVFLTDLKKILGLLSAEELKLYLSTPFELTYRGEPTHFKAKTGVFLMQSYETAIVPGEAKTKEGLERVAAEFGLDLKLKENKAALYWDLSNYDLVAIVKTDTSLVNQDYATVMPATQRETGDTRTLDDAIKGLYGSGRKRSPRRVSSEGQTHIGLFSGQYEGRADQQYRVVVPSVWAKQIDGPLIIVLSKVNGTEDLELVICRYSDFEEKILPQLNIEERRIILPNSYGNKSMDIQHRLVLGEVAKDVKWLKEGRASTVYFQGYGNYFVVSSVRKGNVPTIEMVTQELVPK